MKRSGVVVTVLLVALGSAGCTFDNIYFALLVEFDIIGRYQRITCWEQSNAPLEFFGGPVRFVSQIYPPEGLENQLPNRFNTRVVAYDSDWQMLARHTYKFGVEANDSYGMVSKDFELKPLIVPEGGHVCFEAQAKGGMIYTGSQMMINAYRLNSNGPL